MYIYIPTPREALRFWRWGMLALFGLLVMLAPGSAPERASANDVAAISAGSFHACALNAGGSLKCWGYGAHGAVGDGTTQDRTTPVTVSGMTGGVTNVSAGSTHTCAVKGGGVKCWGYNDYGQLGDGQTCASPCTAPVDVSGLTSGVSAVSGYGQHTCALTKAGGVKCWGSNSFGELGNGTNTGPGCSGTCHPTPVSVSGLSSGVAAVSAGANHSCALTTSGGVKCWGHNAFGQLGDGQTCGLGCFTPVDVSGLTSGVAAVSVGGIHTCALTTGGGVKCWGFNGSGELGDGQNCGNGICNTPQNVSGLSSGVASISAGGGYTCAVTTGGGAKCWGFNGNGELGDGQSCGTGGCTTPVNVTGLASGTGAVDAGGSHTCAVTTAGNAKCWGWNGQGAVGDGQACGATACTTPADVAGAKQKTLIISNIGQYALPKSCFDVRDAAFTALFTVCDNDFEGPPSAHAACVGDGICNDDDPAPGAVSVRIADGDYRVGESTTAPQHATVTGTLVCDATGGDCGLTFVNTPSTRPWHPWDLVDQSGGPPDGLVRVADILAVVNHFFQDKPLE